MGRRIGARFAASRFGPITRLRACIAGSQLTLSGSQRQDSWKDGPSIAERGRYGIAAVITRGDFVDVKLDDDIEGMLEFLRVQF